MIAIETDRIDALNRKYQLPHSAMIDVVQKLGKQIYWQEIENKINQKKFADAAAYFLKGVDSSKAFNIAEQYTPDEDAKKLLSLIRNPSDTYILQKRKQDIGELVSHIQSTTREYNFHLVR